MFHEHRNWTPETLRGGAVNRFLPLDVDPGQSETRDRFKAHLALVLEHHVPTQLEQTYRDLGRHRLVSESAQGRVLTPAEIDELADAFLVSEPGAFIEVLERQGLGALTFAEFYRGVIQPIARALGDMWCEDRAGFLAVSIATERLRLAVDTLFPDLDMVTRHARHRALVTCHDDTMHNFGAYLLTKAFVLADWLVDMRDWNDAGGSPIGAVARSHFDFVGLSVGATGTAAQVSRAIAQLRAKSLNRSLVIGIGGPGPMLSPDAYLAAGADFVSVDAVDAVFKAEAAIGRH